MKSYWISNRIDIDSERLSQEINQVSQVNSQLTGSNDDDSLSFTVNQTVITDLLKAESYILQR